MFRKVVGACCLLISSHLMVVSAPRQAQKSVCEAFEDLKSEDGRKLSLKGELFVKGKVAVLAAGDCENGFVADMYRWPTVINLRPSETLTASDRRDLENAATRIEAIRKSGRVPAASAVISGRLKVTKERTGNSRVEDRVENTFGPGGKFPAELVYDDIEKITVEELPSASELPVVPICDLFKNLPDWKGKRVAVRAEYSGTSEGSWLNGDCKDLFITDGLKWPASISLGSPAYYAGEEFNSLFGADRKASKEAWNKANALRRGRDNVNTVGTFVGTLQVRDKYFAECRDDGSVSGFGYGHLGGAPAELVPEAVRDLDVVPTKPPVNPKMGRCRPSNYQALCDAAKTLGKAAGIGCADKVRQILSQSGIDSKGPSRSLALEIALRNGHEEVAQVLLAAGAPVNPVTDFDYQTPLWAAAHSGNLEILRLLIKSGLKVDQKDKDGETYLPTSGFFYEDVMRELLRAGADPNARDKRGATALMHASAYGYEPSVQVLLEYGADVNLTDFNGRTALMYAAEGVDREYYVDAIPHLLAKGADLNRRDKDGKTALDIASVAKHKYAVDLLKAGRR